jgi:hypothetical protein
VSIDKTVQASYKLKIIVIRKQNIRLDNSIINDIIKMNSIKSILVRIRRNPENVRFRDLCKVCEFYFGSPRQRGSSHRIYRTPWPWDPRINIQNHKGKAKNYQVKQVLMAIDKLEIENAHKK